MQSGTKCYGTDEDANGSNGRDAITETLEQALRALKDRIEIQDVICGVTMHSDHDEQEQALSLYVPGAVIDYSALSGEGSKNIPVEDHRRNIGAFLPGFDHRQHQTTNFQITIDGDKASSRSQVRAIHTIGAEVWLAHATYHHRLARTPQGWRITYQRADMFYQTGEHLVPIAKQRVLDRQNPLSTTT